MNWTIVVWSYVGLLLVGGLIGFLKARSRASLIASGIIALILSGLVLLGTSPTVLAGVLLALSAYFGSRFARSKKWMPGGIFAIVSLVSAVAVWFLKSA